MRLRRSPVRIGILLVIGLNVAAVLVGRMTGPLPSWRSREGVRRVSINYYLSNEGGAESLRFIDLATGELGDQALPEGNLLDQASWSPWVDQDGRSQVVGRWASRSGRGTEKVNKGFGLARVAFPGGEILDKVDSDVQPASPACWFPDTSSRILFAGGDGEIYRFAFEGPAGRGTTESGRDQRPRRLRWEADRPGGGQIYLGEPCWPSKTPGPLGGRLFVSLCHEGRDGKKLAISSPKLWSLKVDLEGTAIRGADPVSIPDPDSPDDHERFPEVGTRPDGSALLAYLSRKPRSPTWTLRVASLDVSGPSPRFDRPSSRVLAESCAPMPPVLSSDCRWVSCSKIGADGKISTLRLPVDRRGGDGDHLLAGQDRSPHS